jgi:hypothetical protein
MQQECKIIKTNVFGMVHYQKQLVIFLQKDFTPKHSNAINSINIIKNCGAQWHRSFKLCDKQVVGSITEGVSKIFQ